MGSFIKSQSSTLANRRVWFLLCDTRSTRSSTVEPLTVEIIDERVFDCCPISSTESAVRSFATLITNARKLGVGVRL